MRGRPGFAGDWYVLGDPGRLNYSLPALQDGQVGAAVLEARGGALFLGGCPRTLHGFCDGPMQGKMGA